MSEIDKPINPCTVGELLEALNGLPPEMPLAASWEDQVWKPEEFLWVYTNKDGSALILEEYGLSLYPTQRRCCKCGCEGCEDFDEHFNVFCASDELKPFCEEEKQGTRAL